MRQVRSSYGTFGVVYEVTYLIRALLPLAVHHKTYSIADFIATLPELKALGYSMMYYFFPFEDLITVEFRKYNPQAQPASRIVTSTRNHTWGTSGQKSLMTSESTYHWPPFGTASLTSSTRYGASRTGELRRQ